MLADTAELMHGAMASQNRPVAHFHLAGQRNAVDQYAVVTDRTVMSYMHISHNQRIASDCRHALGRRAPTDRRALANRRIVADHGRRILALELQVLRQTGHDSRRMHLAVLSQTRAVQNHGARADPAAVAYLDVGSDVCKRFDGHVFSQLCTFTNMS